MTAFWVAASLLTAGALAVLLVPLWWQRRASGRWSPVGVGAALAIVPLAIGLYLTVTTWDPVAYEHATEGERLVKQLAARLKQTPDDVQGWRLLANSYMALGQYAAGLDAYRQVWQRTPKPDNDLKLKVAEAEILANRSTLNGDAGEMIEQVLAEEPSNKDALWYGGLVALERGRQADARARWNRLLGLGLPERAAQIVRTQLAALGEGAADSSSRTGAAAKGPHIELSVRLGEGHSLDQLGPRATLYILARAPGGGPPVVVKRQPVSAVPGRFTLSDADSMIPGRSLADFDELTLVARISATGQPIAQPGDWYAQATVHPKEPQPVDLVIDQVVQ